MAPQQASLISRRAPPDVRGRDGAAVQLPQRRRQVHASHGVPRFPDPDSKGHVSSSSIPNLNSPQYRKAQEECRSLLPQGYTGQGGSPTGGSLTPQQQAQFLKYARCMRAHGLSKFPDPTSSGLTLSGVDPNSPRFQAAQKVCRSLLLNRGKGNFQSVGGGRGQP